MKKLPIIFALFFLTFVAKAQLSQLDISTYYNTTFDLYLDGQLLVKDAREVSISDIVPGTHTLQLKKVASNNGNAFGNFHKPQISFFHGNISIPANTLLTAMVYQGQLIIQNQIALVPHQGQNNYYAPNNSVGNAQGYYPNQGNIYGNVSPNYGQACGQNTNYIPGMNTHWNVPPPHGMSACPNTHQPVYNYGPQAMSPEMFQQLKASIENQWFSSGQMDVFNQALSANYFTSLQVKEIVSVFTFSSDQLKVAKQAYTKTIDPQNYFVVNDVLEFSSSVNALSNYIASL